VPAGILALRSSSRKGKLPCLIATVQGSARLKKKNLALRNEADSSKVYQKPRIIGRETIYKRLFHSILGMSSLH
jgi:hypothetical protein